MEYLELKKATFYPNEIILHEKKGDIAISIDEIEWIDYDKPTLWNFIVGAPALGYLRIFLKEKKFKSYYVRIKFSDIPKLPEFYIRKIDPSNRWGWF